MGNKFGIPMDNDTVVGHYQGPEYERGFEASGFKTEDILVRKKHNTRLKFCCRDMDGFLGNVRYTIRSFGNDEPPLYINFGSVSGCEESEFSFCPFCGKKLEVE